MATIQTRVASPSSIEDAKSIVSLVLDNLPVNFGIVRDSMTETWNQQGCHLLAVALKDSYYYSHGNNLGCALRSLANTAIILEHRMATR